jgi:uncharacterized protein (TIGR03086 family)
MTDNRTRGAALEGITLLERAVSYTLGSLHLVTQDAMARPTPCREWDLRALLAHMNDSLLALCEAIDVGQVDLDLGRDVGPGLGPSVDPVASLRNRACRMIGSWSATGSLDVVSIAGLPLSAGIVTSTGAVEVAVHGWDVARACGRDRPIPAAFAEELVELLPYFVTAGDRPGRFAAPVAVPAGAGPGGRLLALLGRDPYA